MGLEDHRQASIIVSRIVYPWNDRVLVLWCDPRANAIPNVGGFRWNERIAVHGSQPREPASDLPPARRVFRSGGFARSARPTVVDRRARVGPSRSARRVVGCQVPRYASCRSGKQVAGAVPTAGVFTEDAKRFKTSADCRLTHSLSRSLFRAGGRARLVRSGP